MTCVVSNVIYVRTGEWGRVSCAQKIIRVALLSSNTFVKFGGLSGERQGERQTRESIRKGEDLNGEGGCYKNAVELASNHRS